MMMTKKVKDKGFYILGEGDYVKIPKQVFTSDIDVWVEIYRVLPGDMIDGRVDSFPTINLKHNQIISFDGSIIEDCLVDMAKREEASLYKHIALKSIV